MDFNLTPITDEHLKVISRQNACVVALVTFVALLFWSTRSRARLPLPPGASWIWGHEKEVFMNQPGIAYKRWINSTGLTFRIKAAFWAPDIVILADPAGISHILQKKIYDYHHSKVVRPRVARLMGKGLGWVEGESEHKRMRRLVSPSLSSDNLKQMSQEVIEAAARVVNDLTTSVQDGGDGCRTNIVFWTNKAALNVIGRVAFQHDFDGGDSEHARTILEGRHRGSTHIAKYAGFLTLMLLRRFPILNNLPIRSIQAQGEAKLAIQAGVAHEIVKHGQGAISDAQKSRQKDLLSRLLIDYADDKISKEELYEQIATFVISGQETTALALAFSVYELSRHPECQSRLRDELETFPGEPTYDDYATRFPYLEAVLRETVRLYPGLPYMERIATKDDVIPLHHPVRMSDGSEQKELVIHAGQTIVIPIYTIHHLDSLWGDADAFRPERWLDPLPADVKMYTGWSNTLAFSDGPRSCVGMRLAMYEYKVIMMGLLKKFRFEDVGEELTLKISSSLQPWIAGKESEGPQLPVAIHLL